MDGARVDAEPPRRYLRISIEQSTVASPIRGATLVDEGPDGGVVTLVTVPGAHDVSPTLSGRPGRWGSARR